MIDLHLHTTASDGRSTPEELVREAVAAGIRTMALTDHDTVAAVPAVAAAARAAGVAFVPGIEMTAVHAGRDVHVLGYFIDIDDETLGAFLRRQREDRRRRVLEIADRLSRIGAPIDTAPLVDAGQQGGKAVGRPLVAAALVAAGHARDIADAFDRFLSEGRPGFVERHGESPSAVVARIASAGGVASLAHPGKTGLDDIIAGMVDAGLPAIEVFHPDHGEADVRRYQTLAGDCGLLMTGGSDYHGPATARAASLGKIGPSRTAFEALTAFASRARPA